MIFIVSIFLNILSYIISFLAVRNLKNEESILKKFINRAELDERNLFESVLIKQFTSLHIRYSYAYSLITLNTVLYLTASIVYFFFLKIN